MARQTAVSQLSYLPCQIPLKTSHTLRGTACPYISAPGWKHAQELHEAVRLHDIWQVH